MSRYLVLLIVYRIFLSSLCVPLAVLAAPYEFSYGKWMGYPPGGEMKDDYAMQFRVGGFSGKRLQKSGTTKTTIAPSDNPVVVRRDERSEWPSDFNPDDLLSKNPIMALVLIKNGVVVYEKYQYETSSSSTFNSESMAKTLTALVIGILLDDGKIKSLDDKLSVYVPEFKDVWFGENTIKNLLQMSCGVDGSSAGPTGGYYANIKYGPTGAQGPSARNLYEYMHSLPMTSSPGSGWVYDPVCSDALSMVVTKVTGQLLAEVFEERIWKKIGAEHPAYWAKATNTEITSGANQFWAKTSVWAKIGILLANKGKANGVQIVSEAYMDKMVNDYLLRPNTKFGAYGYQTWKQINEPGGSALGYLGQRLIFDTESKAVMMIFAVDNHDKDSIPFWRWYRRQPLR